MVTLKAPPNANFYVGARRYTADSEGRIDAHHEDVGALLRSGCVATDVWSLPPPPAPAQAAAPSSEPAMVKMMGKPNGVYQPATGARYTADGDGLLTVDPAHVAALIRAGCERGTA